MNGTPSRWIKQTRKVRVSREMLMAEGIVHAGEITGTTVLYVWTEKRLCLFVPGPQAVKMLAPPKSPQRQRSSKSSSSTAISGVSSSVSSHSDASISRRTSSGSSVRSSA